MKPITIEEIARDVPARWRETYSRPYPTGLAFTDERKERIADRLDELADLTPDAIAEAIGNRSWTNISCDECEADGLASAVQVGPDDPYRNCTATLCPGCAAAALAMFPEATT